jgi:hypothetical protein
MAKADYTAADRTIESLTAGEKVNETVFENPDAENKDEATAAGVLDASFIDYDVALGNLEDRPDMESFDAYTRRTYGVTGASFTAGEHMRELPNRSGGNGYANDPDNAIVTDDASGSGAS